MFEVRTFELGGVEGLSLRAVRLHMELYKGYVQQVNQLLTAIREQPDDCVADKAAADARTRRLPFEWNGMILHELFFESLRGPGSSPDEKGVFAEALDECFGGFSAWRDDMVRLAARRGVGWVLTVREAQTNRVFNVWVDEHHLGMPAGVQTLFALDLWEHAYLLDYGAGEKDVYVEVILNNTDWSLIEKRCLPAAEPDLQDCRP